MFEGHQEKTTFLELLSSEERSKLSKLRKQVRLHLIGCKKHLSSEKRETTALLMERWKDTVLPAFLRYSGLLFRKISPEAWESALSSWGKLDIWILTAYYGVVRYTDYIQDYDLTIRDKLLENVTMLRWWIKNSLADIIWKGIMAVKPEKIIVLASKSYQSLLPMKRLLQMQGNDAKMKVEIPYFPGGMSSLPLKGKWLNDFLMKQNAR